MDHPGHERIALIGHDRGACVGTWFAKDQADRIHRFVAMDTIPTRVIADTYDVNLARQGYWFFTFLGVPDLPEALIAGREDIWLSTSTGVGRTTRTCALPRDSRLRTRLPTAGCGAGVLQDFRAAPQDVARDREDAGHLIDCPVLTMWGEDFSTVGQAYDVLDAWKAGADVPGIRIPQCGRHCREKRPTSSTPTSWHRMWLSAPAISACGSAWRPTRSPGWLCLRAGTQTSPKQAGCALQRSCCPYNEPPVPAGHRPRLPGRSSRPLQPLSHFPERGAN